MITTQAREYLKTKFKPEFHEYIESKLAGDFAVALTAELLRHEPEYCKTEIHEPTDV
jgi:hypothetical protein